MAETYTTNKSFAQVTPGTDSGTWGPFVNNNVGILDTMLGGVATIPLTNANVQLSSGQYQCAFVKITGAISGNIILTFPGGVGGFWTVMNKTTNSSAFLVTMTTTSAGAQTIGLPPGQNVQVFLDGANPQYHGLPHVGTYVHWGIPGTPAWVGACTIPPYLNCDGTTFSAVTYPALNAFLGGNTLPDARGRALYALEQGTGRLSGAGFLVGGGNINTTLITANMPAHNHGVTITDPGHTHSYTVDHAGGLNNAVFDTGQNANFPGQTGAINSAVTGITASDGVVGGGAAFQTIGPTLVNGIIMIRAG